MSIEKELLPNHGQLIIDNDNVTATILDEELDEIECTFNYDGCVEINTKGYSFLTLSVQNLQNLIELINQAEEHFDNEP